VYTVTMTAFRQRQQQAARPLHLLINSVSVTKKVTKYLLLLNTFTANYLYSCITGKYCT